jgi:superfamily II DNA or RNA helicase
MALKILRPYQELAVQAILNHDRGIIKLPPGVGKTAIAAAAIGQWQRRRCDTIGQPGKVLWLANSKEQLEQAQSAFQEWGAGEITTACYQSGLRAKGFDLVFADECHHCVAPEFRKCFEDYTGPRYGLSATPERPDDLADDVFVILGDIIYEVPRHELIAAGYMLPATIEFFSPNAPDELADVIELNAEVRFKGMERSLPWLVQQMDRLPLCKVVQMQSRDVKMEAIKLAESCGLEYEDSVQKLRGKLANTGPQISHVRSWLMHAAKQELMSRARWQSALTNGVYDNAKRNAKIVELALEQTETTMILVGTIKHGETLSKQVPGSIVIHSRMKGRRDAIAALRDGRIKVAFATSLMDEGADIQILSVLILAAAGRSERQQIQRTGRVLRVLAGKSGARIIDFWDQQFTMLLRQSKARAKIYHALDIENVGPQYVVSKVLHAIGVTINKAIGFGKKK